jgi:hypothetical protein
VPGLVPGIHALKLNKFEDVGGRDKPAKREKCSTQTDSAPINMNVGMLACIGDIVIFRCI